MAHEPSRGEIWLADLNPVVGHEQAGRRPVLIVSTNRFNHGPARIVFAAPLTRTERGIPFHVPIEPPEGGVKSRSFILCDAVRAISKTRLGAQPWGTLSPETLRRVEECLRILLEL
ncbi:MAG: type II toxin-antitoxin system PemK/MazF family toxin [Deferrisomatales bacterium]